jgi:hypothetical protein
MKSPVMVTLDTLVVRSESALSAEVGEEAVMLVPERNAYYDTNAQGAAVWRALAAPTTVREICAELVQRYEVSAEDCERDVLAFVQDGITEGVITLAPSASPTAPTTATPE